ncbi:MAG: hypothetical protein L3K19_02715 [Thermoplasmata archaeon]|nr:hypothetical protein [Thermoplasmata archaeon]
MATKDPSPSGAEPGAGLTTLPEWSWPYWLAMLAILAAAVGVLEWQFHMWPLPPGNDTGHWLWTSYGYAGLPTPPAAAVGSAYSVPPVPFLLLAICVRIVGDPFSAIALYAGILLTAFGLTVMHVARTYLRHPPFGVLMVGVVLFNGTIFSMLFWGGFPNFTGLIFLEESMAGALLFARSGKLRDSLILYGALSLTFLSHDLSFVLAVGGVAIGAFFLMATGLLEGRFLVRWQNLVGLTILGIVVVGYSLMTRWLAIPRPGLINSNPATYVIANIGQIFNPITLSGSTTPTYELPVPFTLGVLLLIPVVLFFILLWLRRGSLRPSFRWRAAAPGSETLPGPRASVVDASLVMAVGWLSGTLAVPALGYLAHVDTDYLRFGFFLPVAFLPLIVVALERAAERVTGFSAVGTAWPRADPIGASPAAPSASRPRGGIPRPWVAFHLAIAVAVLVVAGGYGIPVAISSERFNTQNAHDAQFLDAVSFLKQSNAPGAVLTYDGATRWVQSLTARAAFDSAPTWELFYPYQIVDGQEAYFALNSATTVTDNHVALMYTGTSVASLSAQPGYSVLVEGIPFPVFRITPAATFVNVTQNGVEQRYSPTEWGSPSFVVTGGATPSVTTSFSGPVFYYNETDQIVGGGAAYLNVSVTPTPGSGATIDSFSYGLAPPSGSDPILHAAKPAGISTSGSSFLWQMAGRLGQIPGAYVLSTSGTFASPPANMSLPSKGAPNLLIFSFGGNGTPVTGSSLEVSTTGTGNPAVQLPPVLATSQFLTSHGIHFVLLPNNPVYLPTIQVFQTQLGFQSAFQNSEWTVLEG